MNAQIVEVFKLSVSVPGTGLMADQMAARIRELLALGNRIVSTTLLDTKFEKTSPNPGDLKYKVTEANVLIIYEKGQEA